MKVAATINKAIMPSKIYGVFCIILTIDLFFFFSKIFSSHFYHILLKLFIQWIVVMLFSYSYFLFKFRGYMHELENTIVCNNECEARAHISITHAMHYYILEFFIRPKSIFACRRIDPHASKGQ